MSTEEYAEHQAVRSPADADRARLLARRGFLKGTTLALPAVMAITPGIAQALTSVNCAMRVRDSGKTAPHLLCPPGNCDDGYYRSPVTLHDKLVNKKIGGKTVKVPNYVPTYFQGLENGNPVWRRCSTGENLGSSRPSDCNPDPNLDHKTGYAIVHINVENGQIVSCGAPKAPPDCAITSAACWASVKSI